MENAKNYTVIVYTENDEGEKMPTELTLDDIFDCWDNKLKVRGKKRNDFVNAVTFEVYNIWNELADDCRERYGVAPISPVHDVIGMCNKMFRVKHLARLNEADREDYIRLATLLLSHYVAFFDDEKESE